MEGALPAEISGLNQSSTSKEDAVMMYIENYYIGLTQSMEQRSKR